VNYVKINRPFKDYYVSYYQLIALKGYFMNLKVEDLLILLGERIRELRLRDNIAQTVLAARSGVSLKALKNLENGTGATVASLLRVLRTLGRTEWIESLSPKVSISPMQLVKSKKVRIRATGQKAKVKDV
jgi:DNA-binding XRE family transcriptional regulator